MTRAAATSGYPGQNHPMEAAVEEVLESTGEPSLRLYKGVLTSEPGALERVAGRAGVTVPRHPAGYDGSPRCTVSPGRVRSSCHVGSAVDPDRRLWSRCHSPVIRTEQRDRSGQPLGTTGPQSGRPVPAPNAPPWGLLAIAPKVPVEAPRPPRDREAGRPRLVLGHPHISDGSALVPCRRRSSPLGRRSAQPTGSREHRTCGARCPRTSGTITGCRCPPTPARRRSSSGSPAAAEMAVGSRWWADRGGRRDS